MTEVILNTIFVVILVLCVYVGVRIFKDGQGSAAGAAHETGINGHVGEIPSEVVARILEQIVSEKIDLLLAKATSSEKLSGIDVEAQLVQMLEAERARKENSSTTVSHSVLEASSAIASYSESSAFNDNVATAGIRSTPMLTRIK